MESEQGQRFSLKIAVDQLTVFPGFGVSGVLMGHAEEDTPNVQMKFRLLGEIITSIESPQQQQSEQAESTQQQPTKSEGKEVFLDQSYIIYHGTVSKGDKNKEFKLPIPNDIPPSASYQNTDYVTAKGDINYKIQIFVTIDEELIQTVEQAIQVVAKLEFKEQAKFLPKPIEKKDITKPGYMCCVKPMGVEMTGVLSKGFVRPGDSLDIDFQATNFTAMEINEIFVTLNQIVDVKLEDGQQNIGKKQLVAKSQPGFLEMVEGKYEVKVPETVDLYSFITKSFSCRYEMEVRLVLSQWQNIMLTLPLQIVGAIERE